MNNTDIFLSLWKAISPGKVVNKVYIARKGQIYRSPCRADEQEGIDCYCPVSRCYREIVYTFFKGLLLSLSFNHMYLHEICFNKCSLYLFTNPKLVGLFVSFKIPLYFSMIAICTSVSFYFIFQKVNILCSFTLNQKQVYNAHNHSHL